MERKHILIIIFAAPIVFAAPAFFVVSASVGAYYIAMAAANKQYKEVASIAVIKPPPARDAFRFKKDFRVKLADTARKRFIKLQLSLGYAKANPELSAEIAARVPQLRNIVNLILAGKKASDLGSVRKQLELREEIKASINHILARGKIEEVYFLEFIVN